MKVGSVCELNCACSYGVTVLADVDLLLVFLTNAVSWIQLAG